MYSFLPRVTLMLGFLSHKIEVKEGLLASLHLQTKHTFCLQATSRVLILSWRHHLTSDRRSGSKIHNQTQFACILKEYYMYVHA